MSGKICTFFGHRDCPETILQSLRDTVFHLILRQGVTHFYVGNHGRFDALVLRVLREAKEAYPQIRYAVVLAYLPEKKDSDFFSPEETLFPEGIETVPKRFAILWRNRWMIAHSQYVVTYVTHAWGGAVTFAKEARKKGCTIISLSDQDKS